MFRTVIENDYFCYGHQNDFDIKDTKILENKLFTNIKDLV